MTDYSRECRKIADEIAEITGVNHYSGFSNGTYYLSTGYVHSGPEALGILTEMLKAVKEKQS